MEPSFAQGDRVKVPVSTNPGSKLGTGTLVALTDGGRYWMVRLDGESTTRRVGRHSVMPLAEATKPIPRRPPKKRKQPSPKKQKKPAKRKTWPDAHRNELPKGSNGYDRNEREDLTLPDEGASYEGKPKPPPFRRGYQNRKLPMSSDGWSPEDWMQKPPDCTKSVKELCATWASEQDPADLEKWKNDCVWGWCPGMEPPPWWRIRLHDDDTYTVLCLCFVLNFRCYQPGIGQDFDEFLRDALKRDNAAKALGAVNDKLRPIAEDDWLKTHQKPTKCPWPNCGIPFAQLASDQVHFDHQALTRHGRNYYCKPCNTEGQALFDAKGPKRAAEIIMATGIHTAFKGCFITMPLAPDS